MNLSQQIDFTRNQMINAGLTLGFTHKWTVKLSQALDRLMNEEQIGRKNG